MGIRTPEVLLPLMMLRLPIIDLMSLQQVDTNPETANVIDPIELPNNASSYAVTTSFDGRYAYVGDYRHGTVYVVDKDPITRKIADKFVEYSSEMSRFNQETLDYSDFKEPKVQVWDSITFADNYYQTTNTGNNPINLTPNGRELVNTNPDPYSNTADLNLELADFRGFKGIEAVRDNPIGGAHSKVLAWYTGTVDQALERIDNEFLYEPDGVEIQNQQGEVNVENWYYPELDTSAPLWYASSDIVPDEYDPEEGIGTGWHYSFLNAGERPFGLRSTVTSAFDNTSEQRSRGDFAVPTLFNGNFDASFSGNSESVTNNGVRNFWGGAIPGWSYHNGRLDQFDPDGRGDLRYGINIENLVNWKFIDSLSDDYRNQAGYNEDQPNFALKMDGGDSIVHNSFVVPDWGSFYLDVHVPVPSELNDLNNVIEISLESSDGTTSVPLKNNEIPQVLLNYVSNPPPDFNINPAPIQENVAVDLREIDPAFLTSDLKYEQPFMQTQVNRIGYGSYGFETFKVDIPDSWRGTSTKLKIVLSGNKTVYIDNLSFRNNNLLFGNPSDARTNVEQSDNYLVEKTQYASSYSDTLKTPNWMSYKLDKTWINPSNPTQKRANWATDYSLPFTDKVEDDRGGIVRERNFRDIKGYVRGHQTPEQDRSRVTTSKYPDPVTNSEYEIRRDDHQTFLMTNVLPEASQITAWGTLETDLNSFIKKSDIPREAYIVSGRDEEGDRVITSQPRTSGDGGIYTFDINIPDEVWKVVLIPERAGQGPLEVTEGAIAFGVLMNNIPHGKETRWRHPDSGVSQTFSINEIEDLTGLDFFSEIPDELEEQLESRNDSGKINSANLLASSFINHRSFDIDSIGQSHLPEESLFVSQKSSDINFREVNQKNGGKFEIDIAEISTTKVTHAHSNASHIRSSKVGTEITTLQHIRSSQIGRAQARQPQTTSFQHSTDSDNLIQVSFPQVGVAQNSPTQISPTQISPTQISPMQIRTTEINPSEVSTIKIDSTPSTFKITDKSDGGEVSFSSSIPAQQFINSHFNHTDDSSLTNIYSAAQTLWNTPTQLNIDFQITDLPKGQLAEATITGFDDSGVPDVGTILIDHNANGVGWFIDETPLENSEFTAQDTDSFLLAAAESEAEGKYDLLTTILHELAHLYGFIDGYEAFDARVETENGTTKFVGDDFEAVLDGEHLDKSAHPHDLLNTHLSPGMRKLPSELDVQILQALIATELEQNGNNPAGEELLAALTSDPLLAIANGDFSISDTTTWDTRGASDIEDIQAVLTEDSPFLSNFTQTFVEAGADLTIDEGSTVNLAGSFTDAGTEDTHTVAWDLGNSETTIQPMLLLPMPMDIKWSNFLPRCNFGLRSA